MEDAQWYFAHESEEDRLWCGIFFSMCKKFNVSWPTATPTQKAFMEEITRVNYERELVISQKTEHSPMKQLLFLQPPWYNIFRSTPTTKGGMQVCLNKFTP